MNTIFPATRLQTFSSKEILDTFLPKHFYPDDLSQKLGNTESTEDIFSEGNLTVRCITDSQQVITSTAKGVHKMLAILHENNQIGPRASTISEIFREAGGPKLSEEIALYLIHGGPLGIVGSLGLLNKAGITLAHSWTVLKLRTQGKIRDLIGVRQGLGITEVLLGGHLMNVGIDGNQQGEVSQIMYTRDTLSPPTTVDRAGSVIDGRGFAPGTVIWVGKKMNATQSVPVGRISKKNDLHKNQIPVGV